MLSSVLQLTCSGSSTLSALSPATFLPHNKLFSNCPAKHSTHLQALCKMFSLLRRLFSTLFHQSPTHPLVEISRNLKYTSISLLGFFPIFTPTSTLHSVCLNKSWVTLDFNEELLCLCFLKECESLQGRTHVLCHRCLAQGLAPRKGMPHFIALRFIVSQMPCFNKLNVCGNYASSKPISAIFF